MKVSEERIDDFIARWKRAFGEVLTADQARAEAERVVLLYRRMLRRPSAFGDVRDLASKAKPRGEAGAARPPSVAPAELEGT